MIKSSGGGGGLLKMGMKFGVSSLSLLRHFLWICHCCHLEMVFVKPGEVSATPDTDKMLS